MLLWFVCFALDGIYLFVCYLFLSCLFVMLVGFVVYCGLLCRAVVLGLVLV